MNVRKQQASNKDIRELAELLYRREVSMLDFTDPNVHCSGGVGGLIYRVQLFEIFSENPSFFLGEAYDDGRSFVTVDQYVWHAIDKYAEDILCHWAYLKFIKLDPESGEWDHADKVDISAFDLDAEGMA